MTFLKQYGWLGAVVGIGMLIAAQQASTRNVERRTAELHTLLADTQSLATELTRGIGYGGLIHNFKNAVLRASESKYHAAAIEDAERVIGLADELEAQATVLGVPFELESTRAMVDAYQRRLAAVQRLYGQGKEMAAIDRAVRFDDRYAIRELDTLLDRLSATVASRIQRIERESEALSRIAIGGTLLLGTLVLALLLTRLQGRRHVQQMRQVNRELERSNAKLQSSNAALKQFAGMVSHDLRTPLRHIGYFGDLAIEDSAEPEAVREYAIVIKEVVQRMDRLIDSPLDFTQTGFARPNPVRVDLAELMQVILKELGAEIESSGATVDVQLDEHVMADPELLRRALHNLLGNSLKYAHPQRSPHVVMTANRRADRVELSVSDNGIGIEPQFAERVFEP